ncbi:RidA family protein [uncultured Flavobacterium sp.]|uniref:RidA family protein n=1 Tax=uncultured Flavobacterium sp. TaxID=165435 RepID=UPI00292F94E6|nr:RidA family protein [uncultured Flavobacterium sp.]
MSIYKKSIIRTGLVLIGCLGALAGTAQTKNKATAGTIEKQNLKKMEISQIKISPDTYKPFHLAQGYRVGDMLFISGQTALDDSGKLVGMGDFDIQANKAFENLGKVLRAGGSSLKNVVKVTILLRDMANFDKIVALRAKYFTAPYPADTIFEVSSLFSPDALIEIEATAVTDDAAIWKDR